MCHRQVCTYARQLDELCGCCVGRCLCLCFPACKNTGLTGLHVTMANGVPATQGLVGRPLRRSLRARSCRSWRRSGPRPSARQSRSAALHGGKCRCRRRTPSSVNPRVTSVLLLVWHANALMRVHTGSWHCPGAAWSSRALVLTSSELQVIAKMPFTWTQVCRPAEHQPA